MQNIKTNYVGMYTVSTTIL